MLMVYPDLEDKLKQICGAAHPDDQVSKCRAVCLLQSFIYSFYSFIKTGRNLKQNHE